MKNWRVASTLPRSRWIAGWLRLALSAFVETALPLFGAVYLVMFVLGDFGWDGIFGFMVLTGRALNRSSSPLRELAITRQQGIAVAAE